MSASVTGTKSDFAATPIPSTGALGALGVRATRYSESSTFDFVFTNASLVPLSNFSATLSPGSASYTVVSGFPESCTGKTLFLYNQSCTARITFNPGSAPPDQSIVLHFDRLVGGPYEFNASLTDAQIAPGVYIDPATTDFGTHLVRDPASTSYYQKVLTVTNYSTIEGVTNLGFSTSGTGAYTIVAGGGSSCVVGQTLAANGGSCTLTVRFKPGTVGAIPGSIDFTGNNLLPPTSIALTGNGVNLLFTPAAIDFGTVDLLTPTTYPTTIKLSNTSTENASGCSLTPGAPFAVASSTCGATLAAGQNCTFDVTLPSQTVIAVLNKNVTSTCDVGGVSNLAVVADVEDLPDVLWTTSLNFGEQDFNAGPLVRTYTLRNFVTHSMQMSGIGFTGSAGSFAITGGTCTATTLLAAAGSPGDSCTAQLSFDPPLDSTARGGESAMLRATFSSPTLFNRDTPVVGIGTTQNISADRASLSSTTREVGQAGSQSQTINLINNGTRTANLSYSALTGPPFARGGTCGATLAVGLSCTMVIATSAAAAAASHLQNLVVAETLNGHTQTITIPISGQTLAAPVLQAIDDRGNTSYTATITTSDITGPTNNANNIVDLSPTTRDVTYTVKNNSVGGATLNTMSVLLTYQSGTNSRMAVQSDTCSSANLISGATCTLVIRYFPVTMSETSTYSLAVAGTSATSGTTSTFAVTNIIGTSIRAALLTLTAAATVDLGSISSAGSVQTAIYVLQNTGDQIASSLVYGFTAGTSTYYSVDTGVASACSASLAGGSTCNIRLTFAPSGVAGSFPSTFSISGAQPGASLSRALRGSADDSQIFGNDNAGVEGDVTADSTRYYLASRLLSNTNSYTLLLNLCSKTAKGVLDSSTCVANNIGTILGAAGTSNIAGNLAGSGPRVTVQNKKILIAVQNKDGSFGGDATGGTGTVVVCQKPAAGNTIAAGTCTSFVLNGTAQSGQFSSVVATSNKVVLSATSSDHHLLLTACDFTDSTATTDATTITTSSCVTNSSITAAEQGWYTSLFFDGTRAIVASFDKPGSPPYALHLSACSFSSGTNVFSTCTGVTADNTLLVDGGSNLYPGNYPSIAVSGNDIYVAHAQGELLKMRLRLSHCTIGAVNAFSCFAAETVNSVAGTGATPRLAISGSTSSGRLWISGVQFSDPLDNSSNGKIAVYQCSLPLTGANCTSVTPYFTQSSYLGMGPIYSRSMYFDSVNSLLVFPFDVTDGTNTHKNGILNIGLFPEL